MAGVDEEAILMEALTEAAEDEWLDDGKIAKIGSEDEFDGYFLISAVFCDFAAPAQKNMDLFDYIN